jgi:nucleoside-diphosphate kinase
MQRTLIILKPDAVRRRLCGEIIRRIENKGLTIVGMKQSRIEKSVAEKHYAEHAAKPFFGDLVSFMTGGDVVILAVEGDESISVMRTLMGKTKFTDAQPGTIRGDYAYSFTENLIHGSDSPDSAARELMLFFPELK